MPSNSLTLRAMAYNNAWANHRLLLACAALSQAEFEVPRTSFFPSIQATLNHILVVDRFYVDALEGGTLGPAAWANPVPCRTVAELHPAQVIVDRRLIAWCNSMGENGANQTIRVNRETRVQTERADRLLLHLFQHQIHHRGQAHSMLTAMNNAVVEQTKATRAAQQAAAAAASEARTARDALTLTVNTEVEADGIACTDIQDLGPTFRLKVSNRGSRRATDVHVTWGYEIGGAQPQATVADFCKHSENLIAPILEAGASLPPVEMTGLWGCIKDPASAEFKTAVIHEIEHGGRTFNVIGHVDFIDIIGMPQTKPFEYSYQPNYSLPDDKRVWTCNFIPQFRPRPASSAGHHP